MLTESGVLLQHADASLTAVSAEDVATRFAAMPDFRKALYQTP